MKFIPSRRNKPILKALCQGMEKRPLVPGAENWGGEHGTK